MKNSRRLLLVFKYLFEQTDRNHTATIAEINGYLHKSGLEGDRTTITDCIDELIDLGYDIQCIRSRQNLYYLTCIGTPAKRNK